MPSMPPQVPRSATSIHTGIVAAVTTIAVSIVLYCKLWETGNISRNKRIPKQGHPNAFIDQEVPSITLSQGSSSFKISETNANVILNGDGQFTKIQRKLICDYIANLPDINNNLNEHVLTQSITILPRAEAGFKDYRNTKKSRPCFKGTRLALLRQMADCVTGSSESRMYVLSGLAGVGKSTVAYTIASRAADLNLLGASFFFSRDDADRNNAKRFFTTIAYQLCVYNEAFSEAIGGVLETTNESIATTQNPLLQLKLFILDPLRSIVQSYSWPILIVVDALDECDEEDALSVLSGLSQLIRDFPPFRVILTTRPQPYFDRFWSSQDGCKFFHLQDMKDKVVDGDIRLYFDHNLSMKQVQKFYPAQQWYASDEEIDSLVCAAGKLFIIASTAVRYTLDKNASNPAAQMQKLLRVSAQDHTPLHNLDRFYTVILHDVVPEDCDDDDIVSRYQLVVGTIILVQHPLSVSTLAHLISIDVEEIRAVLDKLQSVIILGDDDVPRIYHQSFLEYLTDQSRCKDPHLQIDPRIRHTQIAIRCFKTMCAHLKYNILGLGDPARFMSNEDGFEEDGITDEQLEEKIPQQLRYACVYWPSHLEAANTEDADLVNVLEIFLDKHLLHWFEVLSLVGTLNLAHPAIDVVLKILNPPSDFYKLSSDASRFVAKFYDTIKRSALHTYYSALPFTPPESLLHRRYIKELVHNICRIGGGLKKWDALTARLNHGRHVNVVKFSLDSTLFVSYSERDDYGIQGKLKVWDVATATPISKILGDKFAVANDFSTVASSQDNIATLYNVNGAPSGTVFTTPSRMERLAISSQSRVAAALSDQTVWLWESRNAELIDCFDGFYSSLSWFRLEFSTTGTRLACSMANGIKLRDGTSGRFIADLQCGFGHKFEFSGDGSRIVSLSRDLTLWDSESGQLIAAVSNFDQYGLAISVNGSLLATTDLSRNVTLWSENHDSLAQIEVLEVGQPESMAFSLDNILAIATSTGPVKLYNVKTHSFISTLPLGRLPVAPAFSPNCTHLAAGGFDGKVNLYDIRGIDASSSPSKRRATAVTALTLSQDCSRLACGFEYGIVVLWGTSPTKRRIASHKAHNISVQTVVFSPDGGLFASGSDDGIIKLWNGKDGALCGTLKTPDRLVSVALSNSMLVAARDGCVTLWSLDTLSLIHTFMDSSYEAPTVSIAENNTLIAVADYYGVSLLDAVNHRAITAYDVPGGIYTTAFLPDNLQFVAQSTNSGFLSFNLINKHVVGPIPDHLIQPPDTPLWHGVPICYRQNKEQGYFSVLFPKHKSPVPVLWIPRHIVVTARTQGSSMIALGRRDGRVIILRLPSNHIG